jgi:nucleotide-binding universal stress UspA family protein
MYERIIAGTDLSKTAKVATDRAARLAADLGAELFLVHAGSDPNKVSHHSPTDLLIVKTDPPPKEIAPYRRVLVGTDGSPTATRAVKIASGLASKLNAQPLIVCAYEPLTEAELARLRADPNDPVAQWNAPKVASSTPEEFRWRIADSVKAEDVLERAKEIAVEQGTLPQVRAVEGHPVEQLISIAESEGIDLIAVGSVGMTGPKRFMLGNVPNRISHHSPTDVLILQTS